MAYLPPSESVELVSMIVGAYDVKVFKVKGEMFLCKYMSDRELPCLVKDIHYPKMPVSVDHELFRRKV